MVLPFACSPSIEDRALYAVTVYWAQPPLHVVSRAIDTTFLYQATIVASVAVL